MFWIVLVLTADSKVRSRYIVQAESLEAAEAGMKDLDAKERAVDDALLWNGEQFSFEPLEWHVHQPLLGSRIKVVQV